MDANAHARKDSTSLMQGLLQIKLSSANAESPARHSSLVYPLSYIPTSPSLAPSSTPRTMAASTLFRPRPVAPASSCPSTTPTKPSTLPRLSPRSRAAPIAPRAVLSGIPPSPPPPVPPSSPKPSSSTVPASPSSRKQPTLLSSLSSPTSLASLASLGGGVLLAGAAVMHGAHLPVHETASAVGVSSIVIEHHEHLLPSSLREYGPGDVLGQAFGPTQPAWSYLLHEAKARSQELCDWYNAWLEESPLLCKIVTGNFFTVAGDMLAQLGTGGGGGGHGGDASSSSTSASSPKRSVDWMRTLRLCVETSAVGTPLGHWWFGLLDGRIMPEDPHCVAAVLTKTAVDQLLFAPFGLLLFFVCIKMLEGRPRDIPGALRTNYLRALLGGYVLWPAASVVNFALLPSEYRLLFNNCINILWTCFLSIMSSSKPAEETSSPIPAEAPAPAVSAASPTPAPAAAHDLTAAALAAAAVSTSLCASPPALAAATGLAVGMVESLAHTHTHAHGHADVCAATAPSPHAMAVAMAVAESEQGMGGLVSGPGLQLCQQAEGAEVEAR